MLKKISATKEKHIDDVAVMQNSHAREIKSLKQSHANEIHYQESKYYQDSPRSMKNMVDLKNELDKAQSCITSCSDQAKAANHMARNAKHQSVVSLKISASATKKAEMLGRELEKVMEENKVLQNEVADLENELYEVKSQPEIAEIKREPKRRQCDSNVHSWPLHVWKIILNQLVNGTPPSSINSNIIAHVKLLSPRTVIKELPNIWTVRRACSVLLVVVQTLAACCLAKAEKWGQLFTDGTSRRQLLFQNLVISLKEDDMFQPLLLSSCMFPEDETSETLCLSIVETIKEKAKLLERWRTMHENNFGLDHDILLAEELDLGKLGCGCGGVVMTDTCSVARKCRQVIVG